MGFGCTASGVGIGAARAAGDNVRRRRLTRELGIVSPVLRGVIATEEENPALSWFKQTIPVDKSYYTGFLFGDAVLFYALTWVPYPGIEKENKHFFQQTQQLTEHEPNAGQE